MAKQIFRKVALERASSPEQLDQLITITTPLGWLSLLAIGILLVVTIIWGIYGSIPTQVQGQGILLQKEGLVSIQAQNAGKVTRLDVEIGDVVEADQVVARLQQDDVLDQLNKAQLDLNNLETSFGEKKKADGEAGKIQLAKLQQDRVNQNQQIKNSENQLSAQQAFKQQQQQLKAGYQKLVNEGVVSKNKIVEIENDIVKIDQNINTIKLDIERAKNQLNSIDLEIKKLESTGTMDELTYTQKVEKAKLDIKNLQSKFAESSQVVSPYPGRVVEIPKKVGDLVNPGTTLVVMEKIGEGNDLEMVAYFSPMVGKQIQRGMNAQISPTTVKREEYGSMEGIISSVDKYPSTFTTVMKTLQNDTLAQMLVANSAPIKVTADFIPDPNTASGYKWTSRGGPPIQVDSGTMCFVTVTVQDQAPITLVIPLLKKYILGEGK
jgi:HlyD family secretion protein